MTTRRCEGCGMIHECNDPLFAGHIGYLLAWTDYPKSGSGRFKGIASRGRVTQVHPAKYGPAGFLMKADSLVVECDDGITRVIEDWLFLQSIGTLRVLDISHATSAPSAVPSGSLPSGRDAASGPRRPVPPDGTAVRAGAHGRGLGATEDRAVADVGRPTPVAPFPDRPSSIDARTHHTTDEPASESRPSRGSPGPGLTTPREDPAVGRPARSRR